MTALIELLLLVAFALVTMLFGWWAVPLVGLVAGVALRHHRWPFVASGFLAAAAWGLMLLGGTVRGAPVPAFAASLGGAMGVPGWALYVATLAFAFVLGGGAARLGWAVAGRESSGA
jgi:hypothetical protein